MAEQRHPWETRVLLLGEKLLDSTSQGWDDSRRLLSLWDIMNLFACDKLTSSIFSLTFIRGFRDAWRNHVMHTRAEYSREDASAVLSHVKRLLQTLAVHIKEV